MAPPASRACLAVRDAERAIEGGEVAGGGAFRRGRGPENAFPRLGRGGSDTSVVAVAAGIKADRCDIYTDVDGVYTTDPA